MLLIEHTQRNKMQNEFLVIYPNHNTFNFIMLFHDPKSGQ